MPTNPLTAWFEYLLAIHDHSRNLSHLADKDVMKFALQKPGVVLPALTLQQNLSAFLDTHFQQRVPQQTYDVATFRNFVEALAGKRDAILRSMFYSVAINHKPDVIELSQAKFGAASPSDVLGAAAAHVELFDRIDAATPTSFFPGTDPERARFNNLLATSATVDDAVKGTLL